MTIRALDLRLKVALVTLGAICAAMAARPAHSATAQPAFPQAAAQAICQLSTQVKERDQAGFWQQVDREFKLTDRQRHDVRLFCLGYIKGLTDGLKPSA